MNYSQIIETYLQNPENEQLLQQLEQQKQFDIKCINNQLMIDNDGNQFQIILSQNVNIQKMSTLKIEFQKIFHELSDDQSLVIIIEGNVQNFKELQQITNNDQCTIKIVIFSEKRDTDFFNNIKENYSREIFVLRKKINCQSLSKDGSILTSNKKLRIDFKNVESEPQQQTNQNQDYIEQIVNPNNENQQQQLQQQQIQTPAKVSLHKFNISPIKRGLPKTPEMYNQQMMLLFQSRQKKKKIIEEQKKNINQQQLISIDEDIQDKSKEKKKSVQKENKENINNTNQKKKRKISQNKQTIKQINQQQQQQQQLLQQQDQNQDQQENPINSKEQEEALHKKQQEEIYISKIKEKMQKKMSENIERLTNTLSKSQLLLHIMGKIPYSDKTQLEKQNSDIIKFAFLPNEEENVQDFIEQNEKDQENNLYIAKKKYSKEVVKVISNLYK